MNSIEIAAIQRQAQAHRIEWELAVAVRIAENGLGDEPGGAYMGVLPPRATRDESLQVACATLRNMIANASVDVTTFAVMTVGDYGALVLSPDTLEWIRDHWAPIGAANDPNNKNANWLTNVSGWYRRLVAEGVAAIK